MARTVDQIIRLQLGNMMLEIAGLMARIDELEEKIKELEKADVKETPSGST